MIRKHTGRRDIRNNEPVKASLPYNHSSDGYGLEARNWLMLHPAVAYDLNVGVTIYICAGGGSSPSAGDNLGSV